MRCARLLFLCAGYVSSEPNQPLARGAIESCLAPRLPRRTSHLTVTKKTNICNRLLSLHYRWQLAQKSTLIIIVCVRFLFIVHFRTGNKMNLRSLDSSFDCDSSLAVWCHCCFTRDHSSADPRLLRWITYVFMWFLLGSTHRWWANYTRCSFHSSEHIW